VDRYAAWVPSAASCALVSLGQDEGRELVLDGWLE
jgi:hypothetical protein